VYCLDAACVYYWDAACVDCWDAARGPGAEPPASLESVMKAGQAKRAPCHRHGFTACLYNRNEDGFLLTNNWSAVHTLNPVTNTHSAMLNC
jgi:hypothetical protein